MADQMVDNAQLEAAVSEFAQDRQQEKYVKVMDLLEKSMVFVPVMQLQDVDEQTQKLMQENRFVELPKETKIRPCLMRRDTGEQMLPIFTSVGQIPSDKRSPALITMPFQVCLSMVMANQDHIEDMVLNPFTHKVAVPKAILEVAVKRRDAIQNAKTVNVTEKQFWQIVHNRVVLYLLPRHLFEHKEDGLVRLQREEGDFLLEFYRECYPEGKKDAVANAPEDFSVMTLNITDDMQITRVDMPSQANKKGMCYRVYAVLLRETREILYYTLERTDQGNYFGQITVDGKHELVEPAPDNGAEIEAVMNLATRT